MARITIGRPVSELPDIDVDQAPTGRGDYYVYVHRDSQNRIFYVGKGTGRRAWSVDRHVTWHHYLKTRSAGKFDVQIISYHVTSDEAEMAEWSYIGKYGRQLVNWFNTGRETDLEACALFHSKRNANRELLAKARALEKEDLSAAIELHEKVMQSLYDYAFISWETGLVAQLMNEITGRSSWPDHGMLNRYTLCLSKAGQHNEVVVAIDDYCRRFNFASSDELPQAIAKRYTKSANLTGDK
jgi:hypothetical protein